MVRMSRHALGAVSLLISLPACDGGGPSSDDTPAGLATSALTLAVPVTVANGLANPVPTYAVGTSNVAVQGAVNVAPAGTFGVTVTNASLPVDARQSGDWQVEVSNTEIGVRGLVGARQEGAWTVGAAQAGAWSVAVDGTSDVAIVNTPTVELSPGARVAVDALPPVTITGAPAVTLTGTPAVTLAGEPEVFVNNTEESPIPVRDVGAGRSTPWATQVVVPLAEGEASHVVPVFDVPTGKRLVIEHIDAFIQIPTGDGAIGAAVRANVGGAPLQFVFPFTSRVVLGGVDRLLLAEATVLYADPESSVGVELVRTTTVGTATGRVTISGRLVEVD